MIQILMVVMFGLLLAMGTAALGAEVGKEPMMWCLGAKAEEADYYVAFRGAFEMKEAGEVEIRVFGAQWFNLWVDGEYLTEGPARFPAKAPEYEARRVKVAAGKHVIAAQVHQIGLATRILENVGPFLWCSVIKGGEEVPVQWKCARLGGYAAKVRRINAQLGWIEWCDTRGIPGGWKSVGFDDSGWEKPIEVKRGLGELKPLSIGSVKSFVHQGKVIGEGKLAEVFGYEKDDISARFFLRDLECEKLPAMGVWRRYDLGRVRLMRPRFTLDLPAGAVVEFGYSEGLSHGRVAPWITLSASDSCNLDHYVARGGAQEFEPLTPKGGRFVEVHVISPPGEVKFIKEAFVERCYYDRPEGSFKCGDELLERIWDVGIETHRACAEDAVIDNPTRERGQWAGDVVTVGMDIAAAGFSDLRPCRRGLVQCGLCAREDGLVSGLCPGGGAYLTTYAAQWISACVHYWELTGDRGLLEEMFGVAERNVGAFEKAMTEAGLKDEIGWGFVDWGYVRNEGPTDMAVNLHYLAALRDMVRWCEVIGKRDRAEYYRGLEKRMAGIVGRWFEGMKKGGKYEWAGIGYHRAVLGMRLGFFEGEARKACVEFIKRHMLDCFPNNVDAPRLSDPNANHPRLITPYFAQYAMPLLIEAGEMDFVLGQYRKCWGWMLGDGRTTWVEVFDTRWSHCHQWAGCPTWQLSKYVLGLWPRFDLGVDHFVLDVKSGVIGAAEGALPLRGGGVVKVKWKKEGGGVRYSVELPRAIWVHRVGVGGVIGEGLKVEGRWEAELR